MQLVKVEKPAIPINWDYNDSIERVKQVIYKWKNLTEELAQELWIAREMLSIQGSRTDLTSGQKSRSWTQYCEDKGHTIGGLTFLPSHQLKEVKDGSVWRSAKKLD